MFEKSFSLATFSFATQFSAHPPEMTRLSEGRFFAIHFAVLHTEVAVDALDVVNLHAKEGYFIKKPIDGT